MTLGEKLLHINRTLILLICLVAGIGFAMLYSAANGNYSPWASRQSIRFAVCFVIMIGVALVDVRIWLRLAYPIYGGMMLLLVAVEIMGSIGMGAQRWINLGFMQLQPSPLLI